MDQRESNHHRQSVRVAKNDALPTEPQGHLSHTIPSQPSDRLLPCSATENLTSSKSSPIADLITFLILSLNLFPVSSPIPGSFGFAFGAVFAFGSLCFGFCSFERDEGIGLCIGPLPVYFCGHYSFGPCVN